MSDRPKPPPKPPVVVELRWEGHQRLAGRAGGAPVVLDGDNEAGPSPVQALATSLGDLKAFLAAKPPADTSLYSEGPKFPVPNQVAGGQ